MTDELLLRRLRIGWHDDDTPIWVSDTMVEAADRIEALTAERDRLRAALRGLERASTEVASCGARTGPHWLKLTVANLSARAALKGETP